MLRAPGLDAGDTPLDSLTALAAHYVSVLTGIVDDRPLVFTGFSAGGTIAVEMARLVRPKGWDVRRVVLIDTLPPGDGFDDLDDEDLMAYRLHTILARVSAQTGRTAPHCLGEPLTDATAAEVVDYLHGVDSSFLPRGVPWEYLERRLRVYATGMRAANTFHGEPCDVPLGYIRTTDGRSLGVSWAKATTSRWYDVLDVDRTHSTLWGDGTVTRALTRFLDEVARDAADPA
jgi:thioesterase domain-containing protein